MTKEEAIEYFETYIKPGTEEHYGPDDDTAIRTEWNNFTDRLRKADRISARQYTYWDNPY